ncbi:MAG: phosphatidic acid phosphatase type 2A [Marteilia pararefringens]
MASTINVTVKEVKLIPDEVMAILLTLILIFLTVLVLCTLNTNNNTDSILDLSCQMQNPTIPKKMGIWIGVGCLVFAASLIAFGLTEHFKTNIDIKKTKDLLVKLCKKSDSYTTTIPEHSMQPLETHASDLLLCTIFVIAIILVLVANSVENEIVWSSVCFAILTLLTIMSIEHSLVNLFKSKNGEPRPYFLSVCELPHDVAESKDCVEKIQSQKDIFNNFLIEKKKGYCKSKASMSQPSGHSSNAWAISTFSLIQLVILMIQVCNQDIRKAPKHIKDLIQISLMILVVIFLAFQVMYGRVQEHFHTWRNCFNGMAIGTSVSIVLSIPYIYISCASFAISG